MYGSQKGAQGKIRRKKDTGTAFKISCKSLQPNEEQLATKGSYNNNSHCLFVCSSDQKQQLVIRAQIHGTWRTGFFVPPLAPVSGIQAAPGAHAQLPARGLRGS